MSYRRTMESNVTVQVQWANQCWLTLVFALFLSAAIVKYCGLCTWATYCRVHHASKNPMMHWDTSANQDKLRHHVWYSCFVFLNVTFKKRKNLLSNVLSWRCHFTSLWKKRFISNRSTSNGHYKRKCRTGVLPSPCPVLLYLPQQCALWNNFITVSHKPARPPACL